MLGVTLPEAIPEPWLDLARDRAGADFTPVLPGDTPLEVDEARRRTAGEEAAGDIERARALVT